MAVVEMGITNGLITAYYRLIGKKHTKTINRKQFNLTMDEGIILGVKLIAAILEVPQYVACEHILQVGSYHLFQGINEPERREKLKEHLVKGHLLGDELRVSLKMNT
ncbi:hypothetical protein ACFLW6_03355 [Chloroflexota bacterium]